MVNDQKVGSRVSLDGEPVLKGVYYVTVGSGRQSKAGDQQQTEAGMEMGPDTRKAKIKDPGSGSIWGFFSSTKCILVL